LSLSLKEVSLAHYDKLKHIGHRQSAMF